MLLATGTTVGPYAILSVLDEGGMGEVYLAQDARLGRRVALKVLRQGVESGEIAKRRFGQEAQTASALNHPDIVSIFDVGHADGLDFIAMEYVEGRLASKRERRLTNESGGMPVVTVSPDGKWVVYQCVVGRTIDLHAAPTEGGDPRIVVSSPLEDYHPAVSPSGRCLYYLPDHENLYRVPGPAQDWRSAAPEKVTDFTLTFISFIENPQLSRDGTQLAYSRGRIASDIWLMTMGKEALHDHAGPIGIYCPYCASLMCSIQSTVLQSSHS